MERTRVLSEGYKRYLEERMPDIRVVGDQVIVFESLGDYGERCFFLSFLPEKGIVNIEIQSPSEDPALNGSVRISRDEDLGVTNLQAIQSENLKTLVGLVADRLELFRQEEVTRMSVPEQVGPMLEVLRCVK